MHISGDRDSDSDHVSGMSASKMRDHAQHGRMSEFLKGVPSKMSQKHAIEMYHDVRKGMGHEKI